MWYITTMPNGISDKRIISWGINNSKKIDVTRAFIFGNYSDSFAAYKRLIDEAKKDFPGFLKDEDITLGKVRNSGYMDSFIVISFLLPRKAKHPSYKDWSRFDFNY
jgi:hypothetical protein